MIDKTVAADNQFDPDVEAQRLQVSEELSVPTLFVAIIFFSVVNFAFSPVGVSAMAFIPVLIPVLGTLIAMFAGRGRIYKMSVGDRWAGFVVLTFLALIIIGQVRTNNFMANTLSIGKKVVPSVFLITFLIYSINQIFRDAKSYEEGASRVLYGIAFFFSVWTILQIIFFFAFPTMTSGEEAESGKLMEMFGIPLQKRGFPLMGQAHPNSLGMVIGGGFGMLLYSYFFLKNIPRWSKRLMIAGMFCALLIILVADSRGTFMNALLAPLAIFLLRKFANLKVLLVLIIALPVMQFVMLFLLTTYGDSALLQNFSRGDNDLETGNSRAFIYKYSSEELAQFKDVHLWGYGMYGPYKAGFTKHYISKFGKDITKERKLISSISHNSVFQTIFDTGYIGLLFFLLTLFTVMKRSIMLYERGFRFVLGILVFFLYFALSGISESAMGIYNYGYWLNFILFSVTTIMLAGNYQRFRRQDLPLTQDQIKHEPKRS